MLFFRPAETTDIDAIVALVTSAYRGDASRGGWTTEADLLDGPRADAELVASDLANPAGLLLVGLEGDRIVTCCNLVRKSDDLAYFGMFAVSPGAQGGGLGKQVLTEAERITRDWGVAEIEMTVLEPRLELIAFYERRGYVRTGRFEPFPLDPTRFGRPLVDGLRLAVLRKPL